LINKSFAKKAGQSYIKLLKQQPLQAIFLHFLPFSLLFNDGKFK